METIVFMPLGYPSLEESLHIADLYVEGGCRTIEIGIPVADAYMDNDLIRSVLNQAYDTYSGDYGLLLKTISEIRARHPDVKLILMMYRSAMEAITYSGLVEFCNRENIQDLVSGDMKDPEITKKLAAGNVHIAGGCNFSLDETKIQNCLATKGFIYMVARPKMGQVFRDGCDTLQKCIAYLRGRGISNPVYCGMGIKTPQDARDAATAGADGIFVGSSIIHLYNEPDNLVRTIREFVEAL